MLLRLKPFESIATDRENIRQHFRQAITESTPSALEQSRQSRIVDLGVMPPVNRYAMYVHYAVNFESRDTFCRFAHTLGVYQSDES